jgi:hypothetical protein
MCIFFKLYFPRNIKVSSDEQKCLKQYQWYRSGKVRVLKIK